MQNELLEQIKQVVLQAGELIKSVDTAMEVTHKEGPANFVTAYDSLVQKYLIEHLSPLVTQASFLGEEDNFSVNMVNDGYTFIIDPIDGTTNFICDFMCSGISVGLSLRHDMYIGVVYNPFRNELFYAQKNCGAYLNGKRLYIRERSLADGVINFGTAPYNPELRDASFDLAKALSYRTMDMREIGSASVAICYVACNRCVAYASPRLCTWDYAAASLIVTEAGGVLSDFSGEPLNFRTKLSVVASTKSGQKEFIDISRTYDIPAAT